MNQGFNKQGVAIPPKLIPVFLGEARYRGAYGGRGSGKTHSFALMSAVFGYRFAMAGISGVILCAREFMNSLEDSSMQEIKTAIAEYPFLSAFYECGEKYIRSRCGRIRYVFIGLSRNLNSVKSKANILIAWLDEAEDTSEVAYSKLKNTVRKKNSEIWVTWNPERTDSPTKKMFLDTPRDNAKIVKLNWADNPWFKDTALEQERLYDLAGDPDFYAHTWEGVCITRSDAQVLKGKWAIEAFTPDPHTWDGAYIGADWGFSTDPTTLVKAWVHDNCLWVEAEAYGVGVDYEQLPQFFSSVPDATQYTIRADSSRPDTISYMQRNGFPRIVPCVKGQGSVEDGIAFLRKFKKIIIHPRCTHTANEARLYSYKVDRLTGDVLPILVDKHNHCIDALRYAIEPIMKQTSARIRML